MSNRCKLQKEYYKEFGNYKVKGKYSDHYVNWLEDRVTQLEDDKITVMKRDEYTSTYLQEHGQYFTSFKK